jgi:hypothetical protein
MLEKSPFNLKGNAWRGLRDFCDETVPGGARAVCASIANAESRDFFAQFFIPSVWYNALPFAEVTETVGRVAGLRTPEVCERFGKYILERDMSGVYRALLHFAKPELMARALPLASKRYFDFVSMKLEFEAPQHFVMYLTGIPHAVALAYTHVTQVFTRNAITGSGGTDVEVTTSAPIAGPVVSGVQTVLLERHVRWT